MREEQKIMETERWVFLDDQYCPMYKPLCRHKGNKKSTLAECTLHWNKTRPLNFYIVLKRAGSHSTAVDVADARVTTAKKCS